MKNFVRACAVFLAASGISSAVSAQTKWDMPTPYPDGNFHTRNIMQFAADVDKATNGSLKIAIHSAGSLIKHAEIKRSVRQGTTPIGEMLESLSSNEAAVFWAMCSPIRPTVRVVHAPPVTGFTNAPRVYMRRTTAAGRP